MKILFYNISWEAMSGSPYGSAGELGKKCQEGICLKNITNYIKNLNKNNELDIIALVEAENYKEIIKELNQNLNIDRDVKYNYVVSKSEKEYIVTIYKESLNLLEYKHSSFAPGRPFQVLIFSDFTFINLHFCGRNELWRVGYIKCNLEKSLGRFKKYFEREVICAGDFNYNIWKYHPEKLQFLQSDNLYKMRLPLKGGREKLLYVKNPPLTCCNTSDHDGKGMHAIGDFIMTERENTKNVVKRKKDIKGLSSDHLPICLWE